MKSPVFFLYLLSVIGSGVGFMTQMLVSGFWTTTFAQDVTYFSVNLAFYFLSLGIGTHLTQRMERKSVSKLVALVIALCLWCGMSVSVLRWGIFRFNQATFVAIGTVCIAGILAGMILPLTLELGKRDKRMDLGRLFFLDYFAAIGFTLLFTFVLLIPLGYTKTALAICASCLCVVAFFSYRHRAVRPVTAALIVLSTVLPWGASVGAKFLSRVPAGSAHKLLLAKQSHYQKIVLTESEGEAGTLFPGIPQHSLYLDGFVQFSSSSEPLYHFCIANIPATAASDLGHPIRKALILGGGDGLVARNLLAMPNVKQIRMVELDPEMVHLARTNEHLLRYNLKSLHNPRVEVLTTDAFTWVGGHSEKYDLIVIDFPSPKNLALARLFSVEFYRRVFRLLNPHGFVSIQAGPYFAPGPTAALSSITAGIAHAVEGAGQRAWVYYTPRDADGFVLTTPDTDFDMEAFTKKIGIHVSKPLAPICAYDPDIPRPQTRLNTLNTLTLATDAARWYRETGGTEFFYYGDAYGVFLPD